MARERQPQPVVQREGVQVVVLGNFNPGIFSPSWFAAHELIGEEQAADAELQVIMPRLASFRVGWLSCQVQDDRLILGTEDAQELESVRDAAVGILALLPHTPISMMGLNRYFHISFPSLEAWHRVGDLLAPKEVWEGVLTLPGMRDVTVEGVRDDEFAGAVVVSVQPSNIVKPGVFVNRNDHYVLRVVDSQPSSREDFVREEFSQRNALPPSDTCIPIAINILNKKWTDSMRHADAVLGTVLKL
jgi:hypothetical protein